MSEIDVLAVIESDANEADFSRRRAGSPYAKELKADSDKARAEIMELFEAAALLRKQLSGQSWARFDAALSRCKPAALSQPATQQGNVDG